MQLEFGLAVQERGNTYKTYMHHARGFTQFGIRKFTSPSAKPGLRDPKPAPVFGLTGPIRTSTGRGTGKGQRCGGWVVPSATQLLVWPVFVSF